ncbi:SAM-dependent methyltransferase [Nocardia sp. NPDC003482]
MGGDTPPVPVTGVAVTALGVAVIRARETRRADRLYTDPLAEDFVDAAQPGFDTDRWTRLLALADQFYPGRTVGVRLVDDRVRAAAHAGIRQFVLLGAGLDTRAFRMDLPPDTTVYEIDLPELFAFKESVLTRARATPTCARRVVPADLRDDWPNPLLDNGFRTDLPTCWIDEGTLGPLTRDWNRRVVTTLTDLSAPGSRFGAARVTVDPDSAPYREMRQLVAADVTPAAVTADFDIENWLRDLGWDTTFHSWNDLTAPLGRDVAQPDPRIGTFAAIRR